MAEVAGDDEDGILSCQVWSKDTAIKDLLVVVNCSDEDGNYLDV